MSRYYVVKDGAGRAVPLDEAEAAWPAATFVWMRLDGRDQVALDWLAAHQEVPEVVRTALTAQETRPRAERIEHGALVNLRGLGLTPEDDPDPLVSIRLWAERGRVISVSFRTLSVMRGVEQLVCEGTVLDPGDLIAALAAAITDELDPDVAGLGDSLDECESMLESGGIGTMRRAVSGARGQAISYRRFVAPQRQALEKLAAFDADWLEEPDRQHLREAADRCARMAEELEAVRERAALMHEQLTDLRAEQLDQRGLELSIAAAIFLPLTFITGLYGMNVQGIPFAEQPWGFWAVVGMCAALAAAIAGYFVRQHWLSR